MSKSIPKTVNKEFTIKQLKDIKVPKYQRWINPDNLKELRASIEEIGIQRNPVICKVLANNKRYIIDGNHLRHILIEDVTNKERTDEDKIDCKYSEVDTFFDAAKIFKLLNTKGKKLDYIDFTQYYRNVYDGASTIYSIIWEQIIGNPGDATAVTKHGCFSLAWIVAFLTNEKRQEYKEGEFKKLSDLPPHFIHRKNLLFHLLYHAQDMWDVEFPKIGKKSIRPHVNAILGFAQFWFSNKLHEHFSEINFLDFVTELYKEQQKNLVGSELIAKQNAGKKMKLYLDERKFPFLLDSKGKSILK